MVDFIGDFLTVIRNASRARKDKATLPTSNLTMRIAEILKREGFIDAYKLIEEGPKRFLRVHLRYHRGKEPAIRSLVRISRPGLRRYVSSERVPKVLGGLGCAIVSTSCGLMTDREARAQNLGGELLCKVW